jgi:hypothetical protein
MRRLLREPLLHFLVLGALLFAVYGLVSKGREAAPGKIVVTQGQIANMATVFARTWQRPPTDAELQGLIRSHVREEVLYREGLALGLERDDPVIRRRVAQKLQFVEENDDAVAEPSDADLQAYLDAHRAAFEAEPRFSFRQVYLDPQRHGAAAADRAARMLAELNRPASRLDAAALGDPTLLPASFDDAPASDVKRVLGSQFVAALDQLAVGPWQGPVRSGYGLHLVQVSARQAAGAPPLADVREAVKREWQRQRRAEASEAHYRKLLARYSVTVEGPSLAMGDAPKLK